MVSKKFPLTPKDLIELIKSCQNNPFVFFETAAFNKENNTSFLFKDINKIITFNYNDDLDLFFEEIERLIKKGYWLSGYFTYEFGYFLEPALYPLREKYNFPLVWLAASGVPLLINHKKEQSSSSEGYRERPAYAVNNTISNITQKEYSFCVGKIKKYLEEGLTYQTNLTFKIKFDFEGDLIDFYLNLRRAQPTSYMAFIDTKEAAILSLSPELFFRIKNKEIASQPMKGTIQRGLLPREDLKNRAFLRRSKKIKAENLMIVDLLRNDLGRIAKRVSVPSLFTVEKYRTLYQMTSTIKAELNRNIKIKEIFSSLFPCGSVTGAPKIKTMQIIKELEKEPRGIYTGAIGYISPKKEACFNVAIRTVFIKDGKAELGVGGGIVYDSKGQSEFNEATLKAKFALERFPVFYLIESILWEEAKGYYLLSPHLKRLKKSSDYFLIPLDLAKLQKKLKVLEKALAPAQSLPERKKFKIRVVVDMDGEIKIESKELKKIPVPVKVKISCRRTNPFNPFLYHKTSRRDFYDREREIANEEGFFEVIFLNINGEVTEGAISNIFILKGDNLLTPPQESGLLEGVLKGHLLGARKVKEKRLYLKDILEADKVYIGNSVRGLLEAKVCLANLEKESKIKMSI